MDQPQKPEGPNLGKMPLIVFVLVLLVPLLDFEFTYYRMTIKLFVFQTATTVLGCTLAWQWLTGRLRPWDWPPLWVFVPVGLWVAWGLATAVWSRQGWLAGNWVVQGLYGAGGALGLAVLLRQRAGRQIFVAASSVVVFVVAVFMIVAYGQPMTGFFGDVDISARESGAAFLLLPTLVAAAMLYGRASEEDEQGYKRVLWAALLLFVLLVAGLRAGAGSEGAEVSTGWLFGLGAGVAVAVWLLLPRWRLGAVLLVVLLAVAAAQRGVGERRLASDILSDDRGARYAVLDGAEWGLVGDRSWPELVFGSGVGTFFVAFDHYRPVWTYAMSSPRMADDILINHPRRELVEVLFERGIVGLLLAVAAGAACVAAGTMALRRAADGGDRALGAGLAAGVVALGVFACYSNGAIGFGAGVAFWVGLGLLGALSVRSGRAVGLSSSPEETASRREEGPSATKDRGIPAAVMALVLLGAWFMLSFRPLLADYFLREGESELAAARRARAQDALARRIEKRLSPRTSEGGETHAIFVERAERYLKRARMLSLGGRVWLNGEMLLARCDADFGHPSSALERYARVDALCGTDFWNLDVLEARLRAEQGHLAEADQDCRRYAEKNPFATPSALAHANVDVYTTWLRAIQAESERRNSRWRLWAREFVQATQRGLDTDPDRYMLRMFQGDMLFRLGRLGEAKADMLQAAAFIEANLKEPHSPLARGRLLVELANAYIHWDKGKALDAARNVGSIKLDPRNSREAQVLADAAAIIQALAPPRKPEKPAKPPAVKPGATPKPGTEAPATKAPEPARTPASQK